MVNALPDGGMILMPEEIHEFSRVLGRLETQVGNVASVVSELTAEVRKLRDANLVRQGFRLALAAASGAGGAKLLALMGLLKP